MIYCLWKLFVLVDDFYQKLEILQRNNNFIDKYQKVLLKAKPITPFEIITAIKNKILHSKNSPSYNLLIK